MTAGTGQGSLQALILGWAGVLPFAALALVGWWPQSPVWAHGAFVAWSAVILSFPGGIRWGRAMSQGADAREYARSVMPSLLAWPTLMLPLDTAIPALALGFMVVLMIDTRGETLDAPAWFPRLRVGLTLSVVACHVLAWMSLGR